MKNMKGDLNLSELKQENLRKSFDEAREKASSILLFTLQWKELEGHFESMRNSLVTQAQELALQGKKIAETMELLEQREKQCELGEKKLGLLKKLIGECDLEIGLKEKQLNLVQKEVADCCGEVELKRSELGGVQESIEECLKKLDLKKEELVGIENLIEERTKELDLKEKGLNEIQKSIEESLKYYDLKERHLDSIKVLIEENTEELEAKEKQYDAIQKSIIECSAELKSNEADLSSIEKSIEVRQKKLDSVEKKEHELSKKLRSEEKDLSKIKETVKTYCKDLELKAREFNAIRMSIEGRSEELKRKEKELKSVHSSIEECKAQLKEMKEQKHSIQKSVLERSEELESKEKSLDLVRRALKECSDELESRQAQLGSIQRTSFELSKEIKEKEKIFDSLKKKLDECLEKLGMKEKQFEELVKEFELKEKQFHSIQKLEEHHKEVELKEKQLSGTLNSQVRIEQPENLTPNGATDSLFGSLPCCITDNGRHLQLFLNEYLRKHDLVHSEVSAAIQMSPDPAKLVLEAMCGFYPPALKKGDMEFDLSVVRRSCITLLEQLFKISPQIKPELREKAMKLASEWKEKMRAVPENSLEVLGFLKLLAAFKLASAFSDHERQSLLDTIAQHWRTTELQQAVGIADKVVGSNMLSPRVKIEQPEGPEHLQLSNPTYSLSANFELSTTIDERSSQLVSNECVGEHDLMQHEVVDAFQLSPDPAKLALDMMQWSYSKHQKNEFMGFDASLMGEKILLLEQLMKVSPKISPQVKEAAIKFAVLWKKNIRLETENSMEILAFLQFLAIYGVVSSFRGDEILRLIGIVAKQKQAPEICQVLGFTNKIPDLIQFLIERKQHMEAARFSCAFGLVNMFPPELILKEYIEKTKMGASISENGKNSLEAEHKAIVKEVAALRAILECITDYKLESRFDTKYITDRIGELEKKHAARRDYFQAYVLKDQPLLQGREYRIAGMPHPRDQLDPSCAVQPQLHCPNFRDQQHSKRPRIDVSVERFHLPQVATGFTAYQGPTQNGASECTHRLNIDGRHCLYSSSQKPC